MVGVDDERDAARPRRTASRWPVAVLATVLLAGCAADPPSSAVGIRVDGCDPGVGTGSGAFVADDLILTAAHTLRGADTISVQRGDRSADATIVAFDPDNDLAYLRVDRRALGPVVPVGLSVDGIDGGETGVAWVDRDGRLVPVDITVRRAVTINTEDIYVDADVQRPGFELTAAIQPGDSGAVVVVDGHGIGVLWARSRRGGERAYAIDAVRGSARIDAQLASGDLGDVDLQRCD